METRPRLKIELTTFDRILETVCLTLLVLLWIGTIAFFSKLPDQIPRHFNLAGQADNFGDRAHIFSLPIIATVIYIAMTLLNKHPNIYNYPAIVTKENAKRLYTSATKFIRILKLIIVVIFSGIVVMTYKTSVTNGKEIGAWFLPLAVGLTMLPIIFYLVKSSNQKQISR